PLTPSLSPNGGEGGRRSGEGAVHGPNSRPTRAMIVGIPKEIKDQEYRVALLPSAAYQLIKRGHQVVVERGAGVAAGHPDGDYEQAGAKLVDDHAATFEQADLIVKVKEPQPSECPLLRPGQLLFT